MVYKCSIILLFFYREIKTLSSWHQSIMLLSSIVKICVVPFPNSDIAWVECKLSNMEPLVERTSKWDLQTGSCKDNLQLSSCPNLQCRANTVPVRFPWVSCLLHLSQLRHLLHPPLPLLCSFCVTT